MPISSCQMVIAPPTTTAIATNLPHTNTCTKWPKHTEKKREREEKRI